MIRKTSSSVFLLIVFSFCLIFLSTCKKDPTSPSENEPQTTVTIGSDGGTLETADFSLQVPAGSFQNEATLSLSISTDASIFGDNSASQTFIIDGLPDEFEKPLRLAMKYNGELSDSSYIAVGKMSYDYFSADSSVVYHFISIKDSSGFLVGSLKGNPGNSANKLANITDDIVNPWTWFIGATGQKEYKTDHFNFKYPSIYGSATIQTLGNQFEETLTKLSGEFNFKFPDWWWQLDVILNDNRYGHTWGKDNKGYAIINVAESLLTQSQSVNNQINISKVLMSLAMLNNNDEAIGAVVFGHWIGLTIYTYISNYINITEPHYPAELGGNELIPFGGLNTDNPWNTDGELKRPGGMQSWIKYMVQTEKIAKTKIVDYICLYSTCSENELLANFINAVSGFIADWWPDYFEKLIKGEIYNINGSVFLNTENLGGTWDINSNNDTEKGFTKEYPDLSTKRFIVNLNHSDIDESASLYLDATGNSGNDGIATLVFGVNNSNNFEHLVTVKNSASGLPKKLKEYYDSGIRKFLVVVVNSTHNATDYLGSTDIELKISVDEKIQYTRCDIDANIVFNLHKTDQPSTGGNPEITDISLSTSTFGKCEGGFIGDIFTGTYYSDAYTDISSTLTIELSADRKTVKRFDLTMINTDIGTYYYGTTTKTITGTNISLEKNFLGNLVMDDNGENTCTYILSADYISHKEFDSGRIVDIVTTSWTCDENSYIEIIFRNN